MNIYNDVWNNEVFKKDKIRIPFNRIFYSEQKTKIITLPINPKNINKGENSH
jgi:hypothetical protein